METKENDDEAKVDCIFSKEYMEQVYDDVLCKQDIIA